MFGSIKDINNSKKKFGNVISTFSGCGGSSLGYKMAGYNVLAALEFIDSAADCYESNHIGTKVFRNDIREISGLDLIKPFALQVGQLDILDGSPPCASFSSSGKKDKLWAKIKKYSETKQRVDDLFFEFIRVANDIRPKVIIAENVKGLIQGSAKQIFFKVLGKFKEIGYRPYFQILKACEYGVPQLRPRIIFVCIRDDLNFVDFTYPKAYLNKENYITVKDAIENISNDKEEIKMLLDAGLKYANMKKWDEIESEGKSHPKRFNLKKNHWIKPSFTISQSECNLSAAGVCHPFEKRRHTIAEIKRIMGFPDDFILIGTWSQQMERLGRSVCPQVLEAVSKEVYHQILSKQKK